MSNKWLEQINKREAARFEKLGRLQEPPFLRWVLYSLRDLKYFLQKLFRV